MSPTDIKKSRGRSLSLLLLPLLTGAGGYAGYLVCSDRFQGGGEGAALALALLWPVFVAATLGGAALGLAIAVLLRRILFPKA